MPLIHSHLHYFSTCLLHLQLIPSYSHQDTPSFTSITLISPLFSTPIMTSSKESSISSISPLTSENYGSWADDIKSWLQLNGLWRLVSGLEKKPAACQTRNHWLQWLCHHSCCRLGWGQAGVMRDQGWEGCWSPQDCNVSWHQGAHQGLWRLPEGLINRIDEQIRVIKSLSPTSFSLDNLYDELAVMAIIRVLPHSFDDVVRTISVLDKFDK